MILDKIENINLYKSLSIRLTKALDFICTTDFNSLTDGKIEIEQDNIFAFVSEYTTKSAAESELEGHRKYIDIQYMIKGNEYIGYAPLAGQEPSVKYNSDDDISFFQGEADFIKLEKGSFMILFPTDLHQPCIMIDAPSIVKKVVVKVRI